tara:strand:+ start:67 stop:417 length:351 start_codon:yes stop_codon:yes gene_type:complete
MQLERQVEEGVDRVGIVLASEAADLRLQRALEALLQERVPIALIWRTIDKVEEDFRQCFQQVSHVLVRVLHSTKPEASGDELKRVCDFSRREGSSSRRERAQGQLLKLAPDAKGHS